MALLAIRADNAEVPDAEESARKMSLSRKDEAAVLFAQLQAVKENVASLRSLIESRGTGPEYVDSLRNTMDSVEKKYTACAKATTWRSWLCRAKKSN